MTILEQRTVYIVRHIESGGYVRNNGGIGSIAEYGKQQADNLSSLAGYETVEAVLTIQLKDG